MYAAQAGHDEIVEMIAQVGTNVDQRNSDGNTALITASSQENQAHVVEALVAAGASVDLPNEVGQITRGRRPPSLPGLSPPLPL